MVIRAIGICLKPDQPQLGAWVRELEAWLRERKIDVFLGPGAAAASGGVGMPRAEIASQVDLMIVLGGDGSLLAVARAIGRNEVPVLGVNLGTLGFLTEISKEELYETLEVVVAGGFQIETRMRLDVRIIRDGQEFGQYLALNDAVISKSTLSRMIDLQTWADDVEVTTYHADGLIAATPTGSSAYSLSAGGPLLLPGTSAIVLTPICPHALTQRPLVLPEDIAVRIQLLDTRGGEVHLTVDGQVGRMLEEGEVVELRKSKSSLRLLVPPNRSRFEVMRSKLRWGTR